MKTNISNKRSRNSMILALNNNNNNGIKSKIRKQRKPVSRKVLKGGRIKDVVLTGVPDELYNEDRKCNYPLINTELSKDKIDFDFFNKNLNCVCPLYGFNTFVEKNLVNKSFVLYDMKNNSMLCNFDISDTANQTQPIECLIFKLNEKFVIEYNGVKQISHDEAKQIDAVNKYEYFIDKTYDNFSDNFSVALTYYFTNSNSAGWSKIYKFCFDHMNTDAINFVNKLFYFQNIDTNPTKIFQVSPNICSIMIFLNLFSELGKLIDTNYLVEPLNIYSVYNTSNDSPKHSNKNKNTVSDNTKRNANNNSIPALSKSKSKTKGKPIKTEPKNITEYFIANLPGGRGDDLLGSLELVYNNNFTTTNIVDKYLELLLKYFDDKKAPEMELKGDDINTFLFNALTNADKKNIFEKFILAIFEKYKKNIPVNSIKSKVLLLLPSIVNMFISKNGLIHNAGLYVSGEDTSTNNNQSTQNTIVRDGYEYIMNGCNHIRIATDIRAYNKSLEKDPGKKQDILKRYTDLGRINTRKTDRLEYNYVFFIKFAIDFILHVLRFNEQVLEKEPFIIGKDYLMKEWLNMYYLDFIKNYSTAKEIFPISIQSHILQYQLSCDKSKNSHKATRIKVIKSLSELKDKIINNVPYKYRVIPWNSVSFQAPEGEQKYQTCGETTTLNTFLFLLYDLNKHKITLENIEKLQTQFPGNLIKMYFNKDLLKQDDIPSYLEKKLSEYCINLTGLKNITYLKHGKYELNATVDNFIAMILVLLGIDITSSSIENNRDKFIEIFTLFDKTITKKDITDKFIDINNSVRLSSNGSHIQMDSLNEFKPEILYHAGYLHFQHISLIPKISNGFKDVITIIENNTMLKFNCSLPISLILAIVHIKHIYKSIYNSNTILYLEMNKIDKKELENYEQIISRIPYCKISLDMSFPSRSQAESSHIELLQTKYQDIITNIIHKPQLYSLKLNNAQIDNKNISKINITKDIFKNINKLYIYKFSGNINIDALQNCEYLSLNHYFKNGIDQDLGPYHLPKLKVLLLENFNGSIDADALPSCEVLNLGINYARNINEKYKLYIHFPYRKIEDIPDVIPDKILGRIEFYSDPMDKKNTHEKEKTPIEYYAYRTSIPNDDEYDEYYDMDNDDLEINKPELYLLKQQIGNKLLDYKIKHNDNFKREYEKLIPYQYLNAETIKPNQFASVKILRLSDNFKATIDESALQKCEVIFLNGNITNPKFTKKFLPSLKILVIEYNCNFIEKCSGDYLGDGIFPTLTTIIINCSNIKDDNIEYLKRKIPNANIIIINNSNDDLYYNLHSEENIISTSKENEYINKLIQKYNPRYILPETKYLINKSSDNLINKYIIDKNISDKYFNILKLFNDKNNGIFYKYDASEITF